MAIGRGGKRKNGGWKAITEGRRKKIKMERLKEKPMKEMIKVKFIERGKWEETLKSS